MTYIFHLCKIKKQASLDNLFKRLHTLPPAKRNAIVSAANTLVTALQTPSDAQAKSAAIMTFKTSCNKVVQRSGYETIVKAIEVVVSAAFFTLIAAMIGFGIGFACGAWTGPGALIGAAAIGVVVSSGAVGVAAGGLTTYRLFKPSPLSSKIDAVVKAGENFEPSSSLPDIV